MSAQLVDKNTAVSGSSLADIFSVPSTQTSLEHSYLQAVRPSSTITDDGPFNFNLSAGPHYLQLSKNYLYTRCKIVKGDGSDISAETVECSTINLLAQTLFKQVRVSLNGRPCFDSGPLYAYRGYLESELNFSKQAKEEYLAGALYRKDSYLLANNVNNEGYKNRGKLFIGSSIVEMMSPVHCDLFASDRLMVSNVQVQLELTRNSDKFVLLSFGENPDFKLKIIDMTWYVKKMQLAPSLHLALETSLMKQPAKYPIRRVVVTKLQITGGRSSSPSVSIFDGQLPRRLIVGFVDSQAFYGDYKKSPLVFHNTRLQQISVEAAGQTYPREPLKFDFGSSVYIRGYLQLLDTLGLDMGRTNGINTDDYFYTTCLHAFDLTPDCADNENWELVRNGSVYVNAQFEEPVKTSGVEMIVYGEFDNLCMIDHNRNVYFDYTI